MKKLISDDKMREAFQKGRLGTEDDYQNWTPMWALRANIWQTKKLKKGAHNWLGQVAVEAVEGAEPEAFQRLAAGLERMLEAERSPGYAVRADVYFAVEELNDLGKKFSRRALVKWLNNEMEAVVTKDEVDEVLEEMGLASVVK